MTKRPHYRLGLGLLLLGGSMFASVELAEAMGEAVEHTTDRALDSLFGLGLPLAAAVTFYGVRHEPDGRDEASSLATAARYGADRRHAVMRRFVMVALAFAVASVGAALVTVLSCRGPLDPHLRADLLVTGNVALAAGLSTAALSFGARALFGRVGIVGWALLSVLFWRPSGTLAHVLPRGHVRYLLGLGPTRSYDAWMSFAVLGGVTVLALLLASRLIRR